MCSFVLLNNEVCSLFCHRRIKYCHKTKRQQTRRGKWFNRTANVCIFQSREQWLLCQLHCVARIHSEPNSLISVTLFTIIVWYGPLYARTSNGAISKLLHTQACVWTFFTAPHDGALCGSANPTHSANPNTQTRTHTCSAAAASTRLQATTKRLERVHIINSLALFCPYTPQHVLCMFHFIYIYICIWEAFAESFSIATLPWIANLSLINSAHPISTYWNWFFFFFFFVIILHSYSRSLSVEKKNKGRAKCVARIKTLGMPLRLGARAWLLTTMTTFCQWIRLCDAINVCQRRKRWMKMVVTSIGAFVSACHDWDNVQSSKNNFYPFCTDGFLFSFFPFIDMSNLRVNCMYCIYYGLLTILGRYNDKVCNRSRINLRRTTCGFE